MASRRHGIVMLGQKWQSVLSLRTWSSAVSLPTGNLGFRLPTAGLLWGGNGHGVLARLE